MSYPTTKKRSASRRRRKSTRRRKKYHIRRVSPNKVRIKTPKQRRKRRRKHRRKRRRKHSKRKKTSPQIIVYHPLAYRPNVTLVFPKPEDISQKLSINDILELYPSFLFE